MGARYLLDTNVIIDYISNKFPYNSKEKLREIITDEINISVITKIELLSFSSVNKHLIELLSYCSIYHLLNSIVDATIDIRCKYKIKIPDAIIAATAIENDFVLLTHNIKDFIKIDGITLYDLYNILK